MNYEDERSYNDFFLKAAAFIKNNKYRDAVQYYILADEIAKHNNDIDKQIFMAWAQAMCWSELEEYETALAKYTWIISNIENTQIKFGKNSLELIIRSFCDWIACASKIPSFDEKGLMEIFDEGEQYLHSIVYKEMIAEFLHSKSIALKTLGYYDEALLVAEEGLALKRLNPDSPGCDIIHHTEIYAGLLSYLGRFDEAISILDNLISQFPYESSTWEMRAWIYLVNGDYYSAIEDYSEAIFQIASANSYKGRGLAYALSGELELAIADFRNALNEDRDEIYSALWLAGVNKTYLDLPKIAELNKWASNIAKFYLGEINKDELINLTELISSRITQDKRLCECYTHIGLFYESCQDLHLAKHYYQLSIDTKAISENEYIWAKARLNQIQL